jgi:Na+/melibiose symporter-like transporter
MERLHLFYTLFLDIGVQSPPDGWFYYALACALVVMLCSVIWWNLNQYLTREKVKDERYDKMFESLIDNVSELKKIVALHDHRITQVERRRK